MDGNGSMQERMRCGGAASTRTLDSVVMDAGLDLMVAVAQDKRVKLQGQGVSEQTSRGEDVGDGAEKDEGEG